MDINLIDKIEEEREIDLNWFYHSTEYDKLKYLSILTEGIKCNHLLQKPWSGRYNGKYYISLSKLTVPDNLCFLYYTSYRPSFIISDIDPIKCLDYPEYEEYIETKDPRRIGNYLGEYQYYYLIKNTYIKGIVYDLLTLFDDYKVKKLLELINILEEHNIEIPIYDYSRRDKTLVHEINKEKFKYYSKELL